MMLAMDTLRWITVLALRDRTWAGPRVYDSPGQPADLRMESERAPFIAVYTDDADFVLGDQEGVGTASLYDSGGTAFLVIEVAVAGQMSDIPEVDPAEDPDMIRTVRDRNILAATDQGLEARIGFIARQVMDALMDPSNEWAELWRQLVVERNKVEVRRGGSGHEAGQDSAQRFASRIIRMELGIVGEPAPGEPQPADGFWARFLAKALPDPELGGIASIISDHLETDEGEAWRNSQRALGLTERGLRGIGIGPATAESQETPPLAQVEIEQERNRNG